jgi:hypothetical protein
LDVTGTGATERPGRYDVSITLAIAGSSSTSESIAYDGRTWTRSSSGPWKAAATAAGRDPRAYFAYLRGATAVTDLGADARSGVAAERYGSTLDLSAVGSSQATQPTEGASAKLTVWVGKSAAYVIGESVLIYDPTGATTATVDVDLLDFGDPIRITPPA